MSAKDDLAKLEQETDWSGLVANALCADESNWSSLYRLYDRWIEWSHLFEYVECGPALMPDFPPEMDRFFRLLAFADIPPKVVSWVEDYKERNGRAPKRVELPEELQRILPNGKRGRPRPETLHMRAIAKEWQRLVFMDSYELRRDMIAVAKNIPELKSCFGYTSEDVKGDTPSRLSLEKLAGETGYAVNYLKDIVQRPVGKAKNKYTPES